MSVGEDALKSLGEDAKGDGEGIEQLLVVELFTLMFLSLIVSMPM